MSAELAPVPSGLRSYQQIEVDRAWVPAWAWYADPRLGKTRMGTHCIRRWIKEWGVTKILITGPLEPLGIVWVPELREIGCARPSEGGEPLAWIVPLTEQAIGKDKRIGRGKNMKRLVPSRVSVLQALSAGASNGHPVIVLINDDVLGLPIRKVTKTDRKPPTVADLLLAWGPQVIIGDESHRYQHAGALRSSALRRLADGPERRFVRLLSGTPDPKKAISFYHQFRILDPSVFGTSKRRFMEDWCYTTGPHNAQITGYRDVPGIFARVRARASIIKAEDYFDVPPVEEVVRHVELPENARKWYRTLIKEQVLELEALGVEVTATHVLQRLIRCAQFTSGFLPGEGDEFVWLHNEKINAIVGDIAEILESGGKVIVSHRFTPEGARLVEALRKRYGEQSTVALNGATKRELREGIIAPFNPDRPAVREGPSILVTQEQVGGIGIPLGRADHLIFSSWSFDYANVEQMRKRIWHQDKKRMTVSFIAVKGTVDMTALTNIRSKGNASVMRTKSFLELAVGDV